MRLDQILVSLQECDDNGLHSVEGRCEEILKQRDAERKEKAPADARALLASVGLSLKDIARKAPAAKPKGAIYQVDFMESLVQPDRLRTRILMWAEEEIRLGELPARSGSLLEALLYRGELPRGDADAIAGTSERQGRRIVSALLEKEVLTSESPRAPLGLAFPASLASRWMPGLFPDK